MSDQPVLIEERIGRVAILTLNRPEALNALDRPLMRALDEGVRRVAGDASVGCVVLTGAGRGFCSGGDLRTKKSAGPADPDAPVLMSSFEERVAEVRAPMEAARLLHEMDKPTIAMVNGPCAGAGGSLAAACDLRFIGRSAMFKNAFNEVGLSGDYGGSWLWSRILGTAKAREFYLFGERHDAESALAFGLAHRLFEDAELRARTIEIARGLAERKPWAARLTKRNLNAAERLTLAESLDMEALNQTMASQALGAAMRQEADKPEGR